MRIELPGATVDDVALESNPGLALINRIPGPGDTAVPVDADVTLEVTSSTGSGPDLTKTTVWIDGSLAIFLGVFQPGFSGTATKPFSHTLRISINPDVNFTTEQHVLVRVTSATVIVDASIDQSYSFQIEDLVPPELLAADARSVFSVEAVFNESIADEALDPAHWRVEPVDTPAFSPAVSFVDRLDSTRFLVTFEEELSFGRRYELVVESVFDLFGNELIEGRAIFDAQRCESPAGRSFQLIEWVPRRVRAADVSGDQAVLIAIWQEIFDLVLCEVDQVFERALDPDTAEEQFLDAMLFDMRNPFSLEEFALEEKRRLVLTLALIYALKGTEIGIISAIRFFTGVEAELDIFNKGGMQLGISELGVDWILNTDDEYLIRSFCVIVDVILTGIQRDRITKVVLFMKPHWLHFLGIKEPIVDEVDHLELGLSELGENWILH